MTCNPKVEAAKGALELVSRVSRGGVMGLGTGSTLMEFLKRSHSDIGSMFELFIPSSVETAEAATGFGLPVGDPRVNRGVDVYVDGADEVKLETGDMVKGGGGALLGEKIMSFSSRLNVFMVGEDKIVESLGSRVPVPVEVEPGFLGMVVNMMESMGLNPSPRLASGKRGYVVSDWGGVIVDLRVGPIEDPWHLELELARLPGVRATGLFLGVADYIVVGYRSCGHKVVKLERRAVNGWKRLA